MTAETVKKMIERVVTTLAPSGCKMGDLFTLSVLFEGEILTAKHDTREYYSGRGRKHNNNIRHGDVMVKMNTDELLAAFTPLNKQDEAMAAYRANREAENAAAQTPEGLAAAVKEAVERVGEGLPGGVYRGCGTYRVGWKNGKVVCALYGGFHDSNRCDVPAEKWANACESYMRSISDHVVKMDGSGGDFYFLSVQDAKTCTGAFHLYEVPDTIGGLHTNIHAE